MMDLYKFAAQHNLRFPSVRGALTVEQLFHLPLKATNGCDLDSIAKVINSELKSAGEESFVEDVSIDPRKQELSVSLDLVKDVIATKQAENRAARDKAQRTVERKKILDAIASKKDAQLSQASLEELEQKLAALD